jgi:hypothetical protein
MMRSNCSRDLYRAGLVSMEDRSNQDCFCPGEHFVRQVLAMARTRPLEKISPLPPFTQITGVVITRIRSDLSPLFLQVGSPQIPRKSHLDYYCLLHFL